MTTYADCGRLNADKWFYLAKWRMEAGLLCKLVPPHMHAIASPEIVWPIQCPHTGLNRCKFAKHTFEESMNDHTKCWNLADWCSGKLFLTKVECLHHLDWTTKTKLGTKARVYSHVIVAVHGNIIGCFAKVMFGTRFSVLLLSHTTPYLIYSNSLLDYWVRNVVLFMSDTRFMLLNSPGSSLLYFSFQNAPIFHLVKGMDCKRFRIAPELFYFKLCCYNRCSMELRIMCSRAFLKNALCL